MPDTTTAPDYYADAAPAQVSTKPEAEEPGDSSSGPTALLPKTVFPSGEVSPGDTVTVRVVRVHDDQVEVIRAEGAGEETTEEAEPEAGEMGEYLED